MKKESEAADKEELRQDRLQKKVRKTVENPTETGSALRKTGGRDCRNGKHWKQQFLERFQKSEDIVDEEVSDETLPDTAAGDETLLEEAVVDEALRKETVVDEALPKETAGNRNTADRIRGKKIRMIRI